MRFFEIILILIIVVYSVIISKKKDVIPRNISLSLVLVILLIHFIFEGYRWQMTPIYALILLLGWFIYKEYNFFKGGHVRKILTIVGLLVPTVFGIFLTKTLPIFDLPQPSGNYKVGSQYLYLKTVSYEDITKDTSDKRELMIKVWYPTNGSDKKEEYLNKADKVGFALKYGLPTSTFNYLKYIETNTHKNAKIVNGKFPVLIFSHGYYSQANGYYTILEEIASHGYIILAINHTYESAGSLFPDGEIKLYNNEYDGMLNNEKMASMAWEIDQAYKNIENWNERQKFFETGLKEYSASTINDRWSNDIVNVLNQLEYWNKAGFLKNHIDLTKIGAFGHSQGGTAAGETVIKDNRVKAAINLDGVQWGKMIDTIIHKPFAVLSSDWPNTHPNLNEHAYHNGSTTDFYRAKILNSGHSNFMDIPLMINLKLLNEAGNINAKKATQITTEFVINFFDKYLLDKPRDILSLSIKYPELEVEMHEKSNSKLIEKRQN